MPLEEHYDDGFGAVGDAFKSAADRLEKHREGESTDFWQHLPLNFLMRHACELYMKSEIVIIHRWLNLAYDLADPHGPPFVKTKKGWLPIYQVHSISVLYEYWVYLFDECNSLLTSVTGRDWSLPPDLENWVTAIDKGDPQSTLFRYPMTKRKAFDREKDTYKQMDESHLIPSSGKEQKGGFLIVDQSRNKRRAVSVDHSASQEITAALQNLLALTFRWHHQLRSTVTENF